MMPKPFNRSDLAKESTFFRECMAENGGFEPPIELSPYNGLANRRLQPLGQLSVCVLLERNLVSSGFFAPAEAIIA
jgi:hypothetical protein